MIELFVPFDLLCCEADAFAGVHGLEHVGDELRDVAGDAFDFRAFLAEDGIAVFDDGQNHFDGQLLSKPTRSFTPGLFAVRT